MATDAKYCYISTTTSQSSSQTNYQNIPYRMPTTTPVIYQGSDVTPLNYMPIAIWSTIPVFSNKVYYNNGTSTVSYPTSGSSLLSMNQNSGPVLHGNGAGQTYTNNGSKPTPFFGRYRETSGVERSNGQVYTGYTSTDDDNTKYQYPPAAPIYVAAPYTQTSSSASSYDGTISVRVYNYSSYEARAFIELCSGSSLKGQSSGQTISQMTASTNGNTMSLSPGYYTFSYNAGSNSVVKSITSIRVYGYNPSRTTNISYTYPVSFTGGSGTTPTGCKICTADASQLNPCTGLQYS